MLGKPHLLFLAALALLKMFMKLRKAWGLFETHTWNRSPTQVFTQLTLANDNLTREDKLHFEKQQRIVDDAATMPVP
jgi:hypothetical protein